MPKISYAIQKDSVANAFINPNFSHKPALVLRDGTLFVVVDKYLYRSDDTGYTWGRKQKDVMGVGTTQYMGDIYYRSGQTAENDGDPITCVELTYVRDYAGGPAVKIEFGGGEAGTFYPGVSNSTHGRWHYLVSDDVYYDYGALVSAAANSVPEIINTPDGGTDWFDSITDGNFSHIFTKAYATESTWQVNDMLIRDPANLDTAVHANRGVDTFDYKNRFASYGQHCLASSDEATDRVIHINVIDYNTPTITETAISTLTGASASLNCISMDRDAYETLCGFWVEDSDGAGTLKYKYALSTDAGSNWSVTEISSGLGGSSGFVDAPVDIMGCANGFMFIYVRKNSSGTPRLQVNKLDTTDGSTYTLDTVRDATSTPSGVAEYGGYFFRPEEDVWYDLGTPGDIRIAYQAGEAIEQELLSESAYPSAAGVATTGTNVDFINVPSASGDMTQSYLEAFEKLGVTCSFHKYVPDASGKMNDRSVFASGVNSEHTVIVDPETYSFPIPDLNTSQTNDYIEQDVRKVFLPPNFHLDRTFLVNDGNFLKRTVWTMDYDGNQYEMSQVVPRFLDNQICYYASNAYVIGESRDPWRRTVLLSET